MKAHILSIGTELLLGDIVNTNAQYIAQELAKYGVGVYAQSVVGDNVERLKESYDEIFEKGIDLILTTGGLGPTKDDLTKEVSAEYFGLQMQENKEILDEMIAFFKKQNMDFAEENRKQADIPEGAIIMDNPNGTAPGVIIEKDGKAIIMMPGPPKEMVPMFQNHVAPYLMKRQDATMVSNVLHMCGIGESRMAGIVGDLLDNENPTVAPYAKQTECQLRITARAKDEAAARALIEPVKAEIYQRLGAFIYGEDETDLATANFEWMQKKGYTIAAAESCTGGLLTATLVNAPGVSAVLREGAVTYSNEAKMNRLGVRAETLEQFGAVSEETAREMAEGIARTAGATIGISTTGIAGPDGGTEEKPVGLVYVGLCINGETKVKKYNIIGNRERIRLRTVTNALTMLWEELKNEA